MDAVLLSLISDLGLGLVARGHGIEVLEGGGRRSLGHSWSHFFTSINRHRM